MKIGKSAGKIERKACDELGRTILLVIHDIKFAAGFSDRILAMKGGKLILEGSVDEVMDSKTLSDIFETNINVIDSPQGKVAVYS